MRFLLSIIQLCVYKIILQFSTLSPIPVFNATSENSTQSISADSIDQSANVLLGDYKTPRVNFCLHKQQKALRHDQSVKYDQLVNCLSEGTKQNPPPLAAIFFPSAAESEKEIALQTVRASFGFHLKEKVTPETVYFLKSAIKR